MNPLSKKLRHLQLYEVMKQDLLSGRFPPGQRLPTMIDLARLYQVSINTVGRSVDLLREDRLVKVKVGDGVCSLVPETAAANSRAEKRTTSGHLSPKKVKIWIEDYLDWQIEFWRRILARFQEENPDIILELRFGSKAVRETEDADLLLGGLCFLNRTGMKAGAFISYDDLKSFRPRLYEGKIMSPSLVISDSKSRFLPWGFTTAFILGKKGGFPQSLQHCVDLLEFMKKSGDKAPFLLWSIGNCLNGCGCSFKDISRGQYNFQNRAKWKNILNKLREHMKSGNLLWRAGQDCVLEEIVQKELGNNVQFMEIDLVGLRGLRNAGLTANLDWIPYPTKKLYWLFSKYACLAEKTWFADECLRVVEFILQRDIQQEFYDNMIAMPIDRLVLEHGGYERMSEGLIAAARENRLRVEFPLDLEMHFAIEERTLAWDVYYYLSGKTGDDMLERLERKIRYLMEAYRKRQQSVGNAGTKTNPPACHLVMADKRENICGGASR